MPFLKKMWNRDGLSKQETRRFSYFWIQQTLENIQILERHQLGLIQHKNFRLYSNSINVNGTIIDILDRRQKHSLIGLKNWCAVLYQWDHKFQWMIDKGNWKCLLAPSYLTVISRILCILHSNMHAKCLEAGTTSKLIEPIVPTGSSPI